MSISDKVLVNTHYTRSVNIERDSGSEAVINAYLPTSRAIRTLERMALALNQKQMPRAWSLVGPYGSGKSAFSVFTSQLLSNPRHRTTKKTQSNLATADKKLATTFRSATARSMGMLQVLVTGAPEPMGKRILAGIQTAMEAAWSGTRGKKPKIFAKLNSALNTTEFSTSDTVKLIKELQVTLEQAGFCGLVIIVDELGKFLEYEARHYGANDIYLLQALAEHACDGHPCNLFLYVMLHQSFEQYAKGLGDELKSEWSKVQGRFEEIPFIESSEQVLRVVGNALDQRLSKRESAEQKSALKPIVKHLQETEALPATLKERDAIALFQTCYPLHPVSALLLPQLCQKIAQNERTLFSYLGSHEQFGLADMIEKLTSTDQWVMPHHVYDYFISNQSAVLSDHVTHRRWTEVITALERLGDASGAEIALLKTIGILNIVGSKGGLKSSKPVLGCCADGKSSYTKALKLLSDKSVITFRKFSNEYRVWQGSDFDLEESLQQGLDHIGEFDLADTLNREKSLQPVVARRYTIQNGALRYFTPQFVDARSFKKSEPKDDLPRIIIFLATGQDDEKIFLKEAIKHYSSMDIVCLCKKGSQLRESTAEVVALKHVGSSQPELNADPVAKREFQDRLSAAEANQNELLADLLEVPQESQWFSRAKPLSVGNKRQLQRQLSDILERTYNKSPALHNELVNRDRPSSQANAARNKLLYAMIHTPHKPDLGIEKFPPEKAVYRSILKESKLHRKITPKEWEFCKPEPRTPFYPVWQRIEKFLDETEAKAKSFADLNSELMAPPYGVKAGILPILYVAVYCTYQHELAIYEERQYRPEITQEMLDRFVRRPDEFTVQRFRIKGLRASIYEEYKTLFTDGEEKSVVQLVRPLAKLVGSLEEYTKHTRSGQISGQAKAVRDAFYISKSPEKLLFEELPVALGYGDQLTSKKAKLKGFAEKLMEVLRELKHAHSNMVARQLKLIAQAFHMDDKLELSVLRARIAGRYDGLEQHTVDVDGLRAFIKRITKKGGSDQDWLENILMFLGHKPSGKWSDAEQSESEIRLSDFAKRILDLETLRLHYDKSASKYDSDFEVILIKSLRKGAEPIDEVVAIDQTLHDKIKTTKEKLETDLEKHANPEVKLAILAELVDDFLVKYRLNQMSPKTKANTVRKSKQRIKHVK